MDVERTVEFLLEQQARFAAQQDQLSAQQDKLTQRQAEHEQRQTKFEQDLLQISTVLLDVATAQERTNEIVAVLTERVIETQDSVKALTAMMERHIAGHD
jgi:hypothetical protein